MKKIVSFGEIMLRLAPEGYLRFEQADKFCATFGGAEANVAVSLARFGEDAHFVTKVPANPIGDSCVRALRAEGVNVSDIPDDKRRACIGCVEQHFSRVPGTVFDQITLKDPHITEQMAYSAAKLAGIDDAVSALPDGYNTVCTDGMFSQGEWQLLSIARAAAANPVVLLLDEITANLDAETEARVLSALRRASKGRTVLSVSHRIYENLGGRTVEIKS